MTDDYRTRTDGLTEMYWAGAEVSVRQCAEAAAHLDRAFALAAHLGPVVRTTVESQLQAVRTQAEAC